MYFRARYYNPKLGQFISRDPLGYVDGMSQYRGYFVPNGVDPSGMVWKGIFTLWKHRAAAWTFLYVASSGLTIYDFLADETAEGGSLGSAVNPNIESGAEDIFGCNIHDPDVSSEKCPDGTKTDSFERRIVIGGEPNGVVAKISWSFRFHTNGIHNLKFTDESKNPVFGTEYYQNTRVAVGVTAEEVTSTDDSPCQCCRDKVVATYLISTILVWDDTRGSGATNDFFEMTFKRLTIDGQGESKLEEVAPTKMVRGTDL